MKKGFSLVETIVVMAILSVLSYGGYVNVIKFQKEAEIDNVANEVAAVVKEARSKSVAGELAEGENPTDFEENGLPEYGFKVGSGKYEIYRVFTPAAGTATNETVTTYDFDASLYDMTSSANPLFKRINGTSSAADVTISNKKLPLTRKVKLTSDGKITIEKL